jgi:hypothetical protein
VPRKLSSSCGLACDFPCGKRARVDDVILENKIEVSGFYET